MVEVQCGDGMSRMLPWKRWILNVKAQLVFLLLVLLLLLAAENSTAKSNGRDNTYDDDDRYIQENFPPMCGANGRGSTSCDKGSDVSVDDIVDDVEPWLETTTAAVKPSGSARVRVNAYPNGLRVDLVHMDHHPASPLHDPHKSLLGRLKNAVKRSKRRANSVSRTLRRSTEKNSKKRDSEFDLLGSPDRFATSSDSSPAGSFESPLYASPGSYVMSISLGTPPQTKTAIADTGSDLVWVQCGKCVSCYDQDDPVFDPSKSSTYNNMPCSSTLCYDLPYHACSRKYCRYAYEYGDQSTTQGDFATETITLTSMTKGEHESVPGFAFGCGHVNKGTFSGTDGLVGLGQGPISFPSQLGKTFGNRFSYCLVSISDAETSTSPLVFGDAAVPESLTLSYTPLVRNNLNPTFYYVLLTSISINKNPITIPAHTFDFNSDGSGGVILDSGTTVSMLAQGAYDPFLAKMRSLIKYPVAESSEIGLDLCYDLSGVRNPKFPSVTLHMANVALALPAANVFVTVDEYGTTCLAFARSDDFSIIGNIQQQNFFVLYDRQNQRVGFAPAQCDAMWPSAERVQSQ